MASTEGNTRWRGQDRLPNAEQEWDALSWSVLAEEKIELEARGIEPGKAPGRAQLAEVKRTAISRALVALGYLLVRRRSIPLPFNSKLRAEISRRLQMITPKDFTHDHAKSEGIYVQN